MRIPPFRLRSSLTAFLFLLLSSAVFSQSNALAWAGNDSLNNGYCLRTSDGGYLLAAMSTQNADYHFTRLDNGLNLLWHFSTPPVSPTATSFTQIQELGDSSFLVFLKSTSLVMRISSGGSIGWCADYRDISNSNPLYGNSIAGITALPGNRFVLAGTAKTGTANLWRSWLQAIDENGAILWSKQYAFGNQWEGFEAVTATYDNGITAAGNFRTSGAWLTLTHLNDTGSILWTRVYDMPEFANFNIYRLIQTQDSGYVAAGNTIQHDNALILKFDKTGTLLWSKVYGSGYDDQVYDITETAQGYVMAGYVEPQPNCLSNGWLACLSKTSGNISWEKYTGEGFIWIGHPAVFTSVQSTGTDIIAGGYSGLYGSSNSSSNPTLFFFGASGEFPCFNITYNVPSITHNPINETTAPAVTVSPGNLFLNSVTAGTSTGNVTVQSGCLNEIIETEAAADVLVFPNPSDGIFTITLPATATRLCVYDMAGRCVWSDGIVSRNARPDLRTLPRGIYLLEVRSRSEILKRQKIVTY